MTNEEWAALESDPRVTLSATGSWLEAEGGEE